jgi:hypothetical protein
VISDIPDQGGLKRAKKEGKRLIIKHKKDKKQLIGITWVNFSLFS